MNLELREWKGPNPTKPKRQSKSQKREKFVSAARNWVLEGASVWLNPDLAELDETANLDTQEAPTLYYLGRVVEFPEVVQVYIEQRENGSIKHWAVLEDRDYDLMERIYEIEEDTIEKFPMDDLNFRVTIHTEGGPSISDSANLIYDAL